MDKILDLIDSMEECVEYSHKQSEVLENRVIESINLLIEVFVFIEKTVEIEKERKYINEKFAGYLVNMIDLYNNNNKKQFEYEIKNNLKTKFNKWKQEILKNLKVKIVIYGFREYGGLIDYVINFDRCNIIAYIDDNKENNNNSFNNKPIISLDMLNEYDYDYLLLLSDNTDKLNAHVIRKDKIVDFSRYLKINFDYNFYKKYYGFLDNKKDYKGIITGLSYSEVGIDTKYLKNKFYNFAVSSQDLFYDFKIMEYVLSFEEVKKNIQYAIIGLTYYSFEYDMSKCGKNIRTNIYYPIFNTMHNYVDKFDAEVENDDFCKKSNRILKKDFNRSLYQLIEEATQKHLDELLNNKFNGNITELEKNNLSKELNKDYPLTVEENKVIFGQYLEMLKNNNIIPIIVICPHNDVYKECMPERIKKEFKDIINEFKKQYDFQYIDFFESKEFKNTDFYDVGHLNYDGSRKFSQILNNEIEW